MNATLTHTRPWPWQAITHPARRHRALAILAVAVSIFLTVALTMYGWDYYILDRIHRPHSPKHALLKPSGALGLKLGILGFCLFAMVYLYPLRKRWSWLARQGKSKHWLDFHVLLGLVAPTVISFHSSFKLQGFAGMAYWTMVALVVSGLVGRYFYAQIPRSLNSAEMSLKEMESYRMLLMEDISAQGVIDPTAVAGLFHLPEVGQVQRMSLLGSLLAMVRLDLSRPWRISSLRRRYTSWWRTLLTLGGILPSGDHDLERVIALVNRQSSLAKKILFLSKTQRVFHLWHVIHRPFSLSFAVFVVAHVVVVMLLGYF